MSVRPEHATSASGREDPQFGLVPASEVIADSAQLKAQSLQWGSPARKHAVCQASVTL